MASFCRGLLVGAYFDTILKPLNLTVQTVRYRFKLIDLPKPGSGRSFRRIVHFPEKYTVKPLDVTNLAGRDPETGRVVAKGIGGGIKHKYHWVDWKRDGPKEPPPALEEVIEVIDDGCRTGKVALVASGKRLKYILATANMKAGDILKTSRHIPRIPVRASEGDAYPLGALQAGTQVCSVEKYAGTGGFYVHAAGTFATILRHIGDRTIVQLPSKKEFSLSKECMAVVGACLLPGPSCWTCGTSDGYYCIHLVAGSAGKTFPLLLISEPLVAMRHCGPFTFSHIFVQSSWSQMSLRSYYHFLLAINYTKHRYCPKYALHEK
ncbi:large ribosomal subunit protein uL2m isoform X1 [Bacillus rossius redtenbacheri]|uniref:large ribosomal subunit protein uL2m isoform X1 n=1 Tax=Bacillus rossius redtenbacheri TaxID=93214 RepID=UPI002FDD9CEA